MVDLLRSTSSPGFPRPINPQGLWSRSVGGGGEGRLEQFNSIQ